LNDYLAMNRKLKILGTTLLYCLIVAVGSLAQIPVGAVMDNGLLIPNTTNSVVEGTHLFLLRREKPLQETIKDVHNFFRKASTIVNGAIKNMKITALNGDQENNFIDKWKHAQILLACVFELFETLIEDDAMTINDKGRILLIEKTYQDMRKIKGAIRLHLKMNKST